MSKQVLGRGLGSLMGANQPPAQTETTSTAAPADNAGSAKSSRGVETLLGGIRREEEGSGQALIPGIPEQDLEVPATAVARGMHDRQEESSLQPALVGSKSTIFSLPLWFYFGGDLALVATAYAVAVRSPDRLSILQTAFCVIAVAFGAVLAITPFLLECEAESKVGPGDWNLCPDLTQESGPEIRHLVVKTSPPAFVGAVNVNKEGVLTVTPVALGKTIGTVVLEKEALVREAETFCLGTPHYRHLVKAEVRGQQRLF